MEKSVSISFICNSKYKTNVDLLYRFNMDNNWPVTVFILNLAFADLMYCSINLPIVVIQKLYQDWTLDLPTCRCLTNIRYR